MNENDEAAEIIAAALTSTFDDTDAETVVDGLTEIAAAISRGLRYLGNGDAASQMGAIEGHAVMVKEGLDNVASAINELASAIRDSTP